MRLTAQTLSDDGRLTNKTIVLTGAMKPEQFRESDADFNVGMAIGAVQYLPLGIYIVLNGIIAP
jgi:L-asparaginase